MASFSLETPVLVAWLGTPLSWSAGSVSCVANAVSVIGGSLLVGGGRGPAGGGGARGLEVAGGRVGGAAVPGVDLVGICLGTVVAVVVTAVVVRAVVGLGVVGRLVAPAEAGDDHDQAAEGGEAQVEDQAVTDDRQTGRHDERPVRRRRQVDTGAVTGLGDLRPGGDAHDLAGGVLLVLAVPELVEPRDGRRGVEVVGGDRRLHHPLEAAGVPRVGPGSDRVG